MITEDQLANYKALLEEQVRINAALLGLRQQMEAEAGKNDDVSSNGLRAYWKPGRKSTDHKAAAAKAAVPVAIVEQFTTTKTTSTIAWAKVTKAAKVDLSAFTTIGEPSFIIEEVSE